jgi:cytochrome b involved in lipid metabolism
MFANWIQYSGGEEVLLDVSGQDATEAFEDVGHSDEAREILTGLLIGDLKRKVRRYLVYQFMLENHLTALAMPLLT